MGQQRHVDAGGVKAERLGIASLHLRTILEHAAVNQYAVVVAGDQVAGTGDLLGGALAAVDDHVRLPVVAELDRLMPGRRQGSAGSGLLSVRLSPASRAVPGYVARIVASLPASRP